MSSSQQAPRPVYHRSGSSLSSDERIARILQADFDSETTLLRLRNDLGEANYQKTPYPKGANQHEQRPQHVAASKGPPPHPSSVKPFGNLFPPGTRVGGLPGIRSPQFPNPLTVLSPKEIRKPKSAPQAAPGSSLGAPYPDVYQDKPREAKRSLPEEAYPTVYPDRSTTYSSPAALGGNPIISSLQAPSGQAPNVSPGALGRKPIISDGQAPTVSLSGNDAPTASLTSAAVKEAGLSASPLPQVHLPDGYTNTPERPATDSHATEQRAQGTPAPEALRQWEDAVSRVGTRERQRDWGSEEGRRQAAVEANEAAALSVVMQELGLDSSPSFSKRSASMRQRLAQIDSTPHVMRVNSRVYPTPAEELSEYEILQRNLKLYALREIPVQGDGNCQFRAVAAQLFGNPQKHAVVRKAVVSQLRGFPSRYAPYVPEAYGDYLRSMAANGTWGDHITLQAAADRYNAKITLITSYREKFVVEIWPREKEPRVEAWLSYYAERHYNSVCPIDTPFAKGQGKKSHWLFNTLFD